MLDPFWRLLIETPRLVPHHSGRVGLEFSNVCAVPVYDCEIAGARPDLGTDAAKAGAAARALSADYHAPRYPCCTEQEWFDSYMDVQKKASRRD